MAMTKKEKGRVNQIRMPHLPVLPLYHVTSNSSLQTPHLEYF